MSQPHTTRSSNLKRAFVATVSLLAAGVMTAACGSVTQSQNGCPTALPSAGTDCDNDELSCDYSNSGDACPGPSALCSDGSWAVVVAPPCNPPPPECPTARPINGSPCDEQGQVCTYPPLDCGLGDVGVCESGRWEIAADNCNPPLPTCPEDVPQDGALCVEQPNTMGGYPTVCNYAVDTPCGPTIARGGCVDPNSSGEYRWSVVLDQGCDPLGSDCAAYNDNGACSADPACRFLVPASCPSPNGVAANGCYPAQDCSPGSCGSESTCATLEHDPCVNAACDACMAEVNVCVNATLGG